MGPRFNEIFSDKTLSSLFPDNRADQFFDALYGDADEGAYDIELKFSGNSKTELNFEFYLKQRPGKCLVCNLTYGLPQVFLKHPIINLKGLVEAVCSLLKGQVTCGEWRVGQTAEQSRSLHIVPLTIAIANNR